MGSDLILPDAVKLGLLSKLMECDSVDTDSIACIIDEVLHDTETPATPAMVLRCCAYIDQFLAY
jgi:hypothetical protein